MSNVVSFVKIRAERLKQALSIHERNGETVIIQTRTGVISAERISCRARFAEVLDSAGGYTIVDYEDLIGLSPVGLAQTSVVNARGEFLPIHNQASASQPGAVLPFARRK
jgi:hypothetical protein